MRTQVYLTPKDQGRALSLEEFEHASGQEGYHYELIDGKVDVSPIPELPHEDLRDWLRDTLKDYGRLHPEIINYVKSPARVFVPGRRPTTAPEPDVAAYRDFPLHLPRRQRRWRDHSPVLVAEILSADTAAKDLVRNRELYLQVLSVREYWILDPRQDPDRPSLIVYRRRGSRWQKAIEITYGETYTTRLLPDFVLTLE